MITYQSRFGKQMKRKSKPSLDSKPRIGRRRIESSRQNCKSLGLRQNILGRYCSREMKREDGIYGQPSKLAPPKGGAEVLIVMLRGAMRLQNIVKCIC